MLKAVDPDKIFEFIPKSERNLKKGEKPTIFLLQFPDYETSRAVGDNTLNMVSDDDGNQVTQFTTGTSSMIMMKNCLKGWKNFVNEKGDDVEFKDKSEADIIRSISRIPQSVRDEIIVFLRSMDN